MHRPSELNDDGLFRRIVAGDEEAFALFYRRKHPAIYRFVLHMTGNSSIAEDVTQEAFMTLIRDAKRFDPARGTLGGFLFGVARNHLRKRWEQDRHSVPLPDLEEDLHSLVSANGVSRNGSNGANGNGSALAHDQLASLETVTRVRQAIATLPPGYREAVVLCDLEEMSYEDAAAALDCPVGTVRSRLHRARALLIEKLRDTPVRPPRTAVVGE